jgi:hypothetical protein
MMTIPGYVAVALGADLHLKISNLFFTRPPSKYVILLHVIMYISIKL